MLGMNPTPKKQLTLAQVAAMEAALAKCATVSTDTDTGFVLELWMWDEPLLQTMQRAGYTLLAHQVLHGTDAGKIHYSAMVVSPWSDC